MSVDVENIGKREGKEVVQLYLTDDYSSVSTPARALKRCAKISLRPGEKKAVKPEAAKETSRWKEAYAKLPLSFSGRRPTMWWLIAATSRTWLRPS